MFDRYGNDKQRQMKDTLIYLLACLPAIVLCSCATHPLRKAAEKGNYARVQELLSQGTRIDQLRWPNDETSLMIAARRGDLDIVKALLNAGADINTKNRFGDTALTKAVYKGHTDVVQVLLDAGASTEVAWNRGETPLFEAAQRGYDGIVKALIDKGANANYRSSRNGWTPLMIAVAEGHSTTASILLGAHADVNLTNKKGRSALMFASWYGNKEIAATLLQAGADPNIIPNDKDGMTALMSAASKGNKDIVILLLENGADPDLMNNRGKTAMDYAKDDTKQLLRERRLKR
jgi:uncharacterized protein